MVRCYFRNKFNIISSKNVISVSYNVKHTMPDNQQERLKLIGWIVGFVDGEGTFSISIIKNKTTKSGYQFFSEFVVTQSEKSISALKIFKIFFKCGNIFINRRKDNHKGNLYRYCVRSINDLQKIIIPFFDNNHLKTAKREDFIFFKKAVKLISQKYHLEKSGREKIIRIIQKMNRKKPRIF